MTQLYGIVHGGALQDIFGGVQRNIVVKPTLELIASLFSLPKGSKVGIEDFTKSDWTEVNNHLQNLPFNPPQPRFVEDMPTSRPFYDEKSTSYWKILVEECAQMGVELIFLEDKKIWFNYNEKLIKLVENNAVRRDLLVKRRDETELQYAKKRIGFNQARFEEEILARKVHEIDRDNALLAKIKSNNLAAALVGSGHADYWASNFDTIKRNFGVSFESYSAEVIATEHLNWRGQLDFVREAKPDLKVAFERKGLERSVKLIETGRMSEEKPDFIGTWDIHEPGKGYFEMFIRSRNGKISGEIIDSLGDADFEGELNGKEIRFIKKYRKGSSSVNSDSEILYRGLLRDKDVVGFYAYTNGHGGSSIYMTPDRPEKTVDLGINNWVAMQENRRAIRALGNNFFGKK